MVVQCIDCLAGMRGLSDNSVDCIVTDPPYGLSFMGKRWDYELPSVEIWRECLRVLKHGGHLLSFGGTRTYHRMACGVEDAGFELRDCIMWVYGSGFPKSLDISKAIDREAGLERAVVGESPNNRPAKTHGGAGFDKLGSGQATINITAPASPEAAQWSGWGTALKPAYEPIIVARKCVEGTVAANVLKWGVGGINVDGCRVGLAEGEKPFSYPNGPGGCKSGEFHYQGRAETPAEGSPAGRWPANLVHDGSDEVVGLFPDTGASKAAMRGLQHSGRHGGISDLGGNIKDGTNSVRGHNDNGGSAARFFYCAKASKRDRDEGLEGMEYRRGGSEVFDARQRDGVGEMRQPVCRNYHPTIKPTDLMRWLCRLVCPPNGLILDPFAGSGSTGKAAVLEGFRFLGFEREAEYVEIANKRIESAEASVGGGELF